MLIGQTILESSDAYYSPWFARAGDQGAFVAEVLAVSDDGGSTVALTITMETKNSEDADAAKVDAASFPNIAGSGVYRKSASGLKELVRYRYELDFSGTSDPAWVHFRMLDPVWVSN